MYRRLFVALCGTWRLREGLVHFNTHTHLLGAIARHTLVYAAAAALLPG